MVLPTRAQRRFSVVVAQDGDGDYNGSTVSTINAAIASVDGTGGGEIIVTAGTYDADAALTNTTKNNVTLRGTGNSTKIKIPDSTTDNFNMFNVTGVSNFKILDIEFDGNHQNNTNDGHGLYLNQITGLTIQNCTIKNNRWAGIHVLESTDVKIIGNTITDSDENSGIVAGYDSQDVIISNNFVSTLPGANGNGIFIISDATDVGENARIAINDNVIYDVYDTCIEVGHSGTGNKQVTISGNVCVSDGLNGILLRRTDDCTVTGNYVYNGSGQCIICNAESTGRSNLVITGNNCVGDTGNQNRVIQISDYSNLTVSNNQLTNGNGFRYSSAVARDNISISDNTVVQPDEYGIYVDATLGLTNLKINRNTISPGSAGDYGGIYVFGDAGSIINRYECNDNIVNGFTLAGIDLRFATNGTCNGNTSVGNTLQGITFNTVTYSTIMGNNASTNDDDGIELTSSTHINVSSNTVNGITGAWADGIKVNSTCNNINVNNNNVSECGYYGILIASDFFTCNGNVCMNNGHNNTAAGIKIDDNCTNGTVIGNTCHDDQGTKTQNYGVQISGTATDRIMVTNNMLFENSTGGLNGTGGANGLTQDNITS